MSKDSVDLSKYNPILPQKNECVNVLLSTTCHLPDQLLIYIYISHLSK